MEDFVEDIQQQNSQEEQAQAVETTEQVAEEETSITSEDRKRVV